ncbi:MAG: hypothetical protein AAGB48_03095 [Planctomycetota bacterium]
MNDNISDIQTDLSKLAQEVASLSSNLMEHSHGSIRLIARRLRQYARDIENRNNACGCCNRPLKLPQGEVVPLISIGQGTSRVDYTPMSRIETPVVTMSDSTREYMRRHGDEGGEP